jgi:hypothetical protein
MAKQSHSDTGLTNLRQDQDDFLLDLPRRTRSAGNRSTDVAEGIRTPETTIPSSLQMWEFWARYLTDRIGVQTMSSLTWIGKRWPLPHHGGEVLAPGQRHVIYRWESMHKFVRSNFPRFAQCTHSLTSHDSLGTTSTNAKERLVDLRKHIGIQKTKTSPMPYE